MKQRFSSIDVKLICEELRDALTGLRVSNIYDLSSRIFLFKLAKPDNRKQLIIDSGFRCHLTEYSRTTANAPSGFVSRLRKYLKTRRVTAVRQLGTDRIIDLAFSDGLFHIFLEFFAGGNIILTDAEYKIIALFRHVPATGDQEEVKVGLRYAVEKAQYYEGLPSLSPERLRETLQSVVEAANKSQNEAPKKSKKKVDAFRKALSHGFPEFPPMLLEDAFAATGFDSSVPLERVLEDKQLFQDAMNVLEEAERVVKHISTRESRAGYIVAVEDTKKKPSDQSEESTSVSLLYEDFHPFRPRQFDGKPGHKILEYTSFNKTVDEYFSSIESQRLESRLTEHEEAAKRKLEAARADHQKRAGALRQAQELHVRKAQAIQANVYRVQEAMDAVNGLIAQGMDWVEIARLIEMEQGRNNPVAQIIRLPLKLHENVITLLLSEESEDAEEDEKYDSEPEDSDESDSEKGATSQRTVETLAIDIDLGMSPWANATQYYEQKKSAAVKEQKTLQSSEKALKSQEKKVTQDLKRNLKQEKQVLRPARKAFWFEKYLYFISTDGYLVLGGRDAHQVEILYRRYLRKGDIFVHADIEGAIPMIIKNKDGTPDAPIPPGTLAQAGSLSVATSKAWDSKAIMPSWWVHAHQVSKTNERGELLASGGFHIKGEKNFLAPAQHILGFAVLFQISKESIANHRKHRLEEPSNVEETNATIPETQDTEKGEIQVDTSEDVPAMEDAQHEDVESTAVESKENVNEEQPESDVENGEEEEKEISRANPLHTTTSTVREEAGSDDGSSSDTDEETTDTTNVPADLSGQKSQAGEISNTVRSNTPTPSQASSSKQKTTNTVRGKKGKAKKAAQKYAHQDEEDRELALRLLGSNAKANKAAEAAAAKAKREAELEAQRQRRRAQHERAAQAERKRQEQFRQNGEAVDGQVGEMDNDEETARAEAEDNSWLPALVGTPLPEDEVLAALPVAAPWPAVARFKYRAKLQPGTVKRGKAIKEILGHWIIEAGGTPEAINIAKKVIAADVADGMDRATAERMRAHEAGLLKSWRDVEVMNTLPVGRVRIVSGGGAPTTGGGGKGGKGGNKGGGGGKGDKGGKGKGGGGPQKGGKGGKKK